jgi:SAM-dependent methyltransferase
MQNVEDDQVRQVVRKTYGQAARSDNPGCGCGGGATLEDVSAAMGYSPEDVSSVPEGANMGLGCGNPQAIASLKTGETVLDLGSGGGFDCFLAAKAVGDNGRVIGVDMTPEMISKARENAAKAGANNVEFRLGEIEALPVADNSVDVIMSNCVINLSPEKPRVFEEAFRVLRPGGRLAVTDIVATAELPEKVKNDLELHAGCVAGAARITELESALKKAGFADIRIRPVEGSKELIRKWTENAKIADYIVSATIEATKP